MIGWLRTILARDHRASGRTDRRPTTETADEAMLITDDEIVVQLLLDNDGVMWQSSIVEETDWSKAKVSRLLTGLDDDGRVRKLPRGRRNVICHESVEMPAERAGGQNLRQRS
ncbi:helix-turn-helix transcriptional regulator [Natronorarus salvus]|uniref:helix-turn-helix transcriptional regulator n=1 Tax=Natronorarus salvus TaxID=3117733 RepID=UPI002F2626D5